MPPALHTIFNNKAENQLPQLINIVSCAYNFKLFFNFTFSAGKILIYILRHTCIYFTYNKSLYIRYSMEHDILQSIKLEITKNLKFTPYLRISLHPFIAQSKSDIAHTILCAELSAEPAIRFSAIRTITSNLLPGFTDLFHALFQHSITDDEKIQICIYLATYGNSQTVELF